MKTVYVLTFNQYDYYKFTDVVHASTNKNDLLEISNKNPKIKLFYEEYITDEIERENKQCERQHYLIQTFNN